MEQLQPETGVRKYESNDSAYVEASDKRGGGHAPGTGAEIALQHVVKTIARQVVLLQLMLVTYADAHQHPELGPMLEQVDA